jgi:hypothetical protein
MTTCDGNENTHVGIAYRTQAGPEVRSQHTEEEIQPPSNPTYSMLLFDQKKATNKSIR